jgi:hypothetical protein
MRISCLEQNDHQKAIMQTILTQQRTGNRRARSIERAGRFSHLTAFFVIMPYIGFGSLPTDVQPIALPLSIISLIVMAANNAVQFTKVSVLLLFGLALAVVGFLFGTPIESRDIFFDARAFYGYVSSFFIFLFFVNYLMYSGKNLICFVCDFSLVVVFFGFILNISGYTDVIQIFVSRAVFEYNQNESSIRGLTSFFPEQSRLANQMILYFCIYLAIGRINLVRIGLVLLMATLSASGQFFVNLSVLAFSVILMAIFSQGVDRRIRARLYFVFIVVGLLFSIFLFRIYFYSEDLIAMGFPIRGINAFRKILSFDLSGLGQDFGFLYKISGPFQAFAATWQSPLSFELGQSFYFRDNFAHVSTYEGLLTWVFQAEQFPYPERAYSVFGAWLGDLKLAGAGMSFYLFYFIDRKLSLAAPEVRYVARALLLVLIFLFLTRSNTSDPTFWASLAAIYVCGNLQPIARAQVRGRSEASRASIYPSRRFAYVLPSAA